MADPAASPTHSPGHVDCAATTGRPSVPPPSPQVLSITLNRIPYAYQASAAQGGYFTGDTISLTVGDPWPTGARTELVFPALPG